MTQIFLTDLFDTEGHLTDAALLALVHSTEAQNEKAAGETVFLSELQRLEIAEHLSFCDRCVLRYAHMLSGDMLITPSDCVVPAVMRQIEGQQRHKYFNKYASMVMAAGLAILFWVSGVFSLDFYQKDTGFLAEIVNSMTVFSQQTVEISTDISNGLGSFIDKLDLRGEYSHGKK